MRKPQVLIVEHDLGTSDLIASAVRDLGRVLLMSAFFDESVAEELGVAFLAKPFAFEDLQQLVLGTGS
jgi:hypothetical protein